MYICMALYLLRKEGRKIEIELSIEGAPTCSGDQSPAI
jgi:hypothetical protein